MIQEPSSAHSYSQVQLFHLKLLKSILECGISTSISSNSSATFCFILREGLKGTRRERPKWRSRGAPLRSDLSVVPTSGAMVSLGDLLRGNEKVVLLVVIICTLHGNIVKHMFTYMRYAMIYTYIHKTNYTHTHIYIYIYNYNGDTLIFGVFCGFF